MTLGELFLAQARRTPDAVAVRQWDVVLTYRELAGRAGALARALRAVGAGPEARIGICLPRTPDLLVAVWGVLLSGAAYVPLDPSHPTARRAEIAADAGVVHVVDHVADAVLDMDDVSISGGQPDDLAHVLYTSGSTGRPKGVLTTHRNIAEFAATIAALTGVGAGTRMSGIVSPAYDGFTLDVFVPLLAGGSVQLAGDADRADAGRLAEFLREHGVTWAFITPVLLRLLDGSRLPDLREVLTGGEVTEPAQVERWTAPGRSLWNLYGPTEITVAATAQRLTGRWTEPLPIGRPLAGYRVHLVDDDLRPVPAGTPGELLVGGAGLARGYLGNPALTAERFVPDPFGPPGSRLYRTGDIALRRPDGALDFLGRLDAQVKISGQRVEPAEIEAVLREAVGQVAVEALPGPHGVELVAFVDGVSSEEALRDHCATRLTPVMVPRRFVFLDRLPVDPTTGKVDRARLRRIEVPDDTELPADPVERQVAELWREVLGTTPRRDQDFLAAGGHSIAVMRLVAAIRDGLGRDVTAQDVFDGRTLAGVAERVAKANVLTRTEPPVGTPPMLSPSQRRLWFLDRLAPGSAAYNILFAERLTGQLDVRTLAAALSTVAERHDVLRWRITDTGGIPTAVCDPPAEVSLPVADLIEGEIPARLAADVGTPFDLTKGPAWRARLHRIGANDHVLSVVLHHAVADGWSKSVLYRELSAAYAGTALPPRKHGYADYAAWRTRRDEGAVDNDLAWWTEHLAGAPTVLDLPRDRPRPPVQTYNGRTAAKLLPMELGATIRGFAAEHASTPSLVVLAAFGELLRRLTGRPDNVVGVVAADRGEPAFADLIGFCVDIVPVRLRPEGGFAAAVSACRAEFLDVTAHPAAALERIVDAMRLPRDPSRGPLVQVLFNVFNFDQATLSLPEVRSAPIPIAVPGSPFDVTIYLSEQDGQLAVEAAYNPDLYDHERIDGLLADYIALLAALIADPTSPMTEVATALPDPARRHTVPETQPTPLRPMGSDAAPATPTELAIAGVWRRVLGLDTVRATDNFFDVGGRSFDLVAVQAGLAELFDREIPVVDLFRYHNIRALAGHVDGVAENRPLASAARRATARRERARRRTAVRAAEQETDT
ncbi:amino acid adenylation domain-containing protein [Kutzneria sp. NPDC052558]|uniref:amino acid adenylation domain-containing protein n=1 Tax=Kutzneria sp. NPDC052558 TaxID=3364121 RepID=UPI0037C71156